MSTDTDQTPKLKSAERDGFTYFEHESNDGVFETIKEMQQFRKLGDKQPSATRSDVWFFFNTKSAVIHAAKKLRDAGYRQIDAFKNPSDIKAEQLVYTVIVKTRLLLQTEHSDKMLALLKDMQVNPVCVQDLFDGSLLVTLDDQSNRDKWSRFVQLTRRSNWKASRKPSVHSGDLGLCDEFRLEAVGG